MRQEDFIGFKSSKTSNKANYKTISPEFFLESTNKTFKSDLFHLRLTEELINKYNSIKPTEKEKMIRKRVVKKISELIGEEIEIYGSVAYESFLRTSDVDLTVFLNPVLDSSGGGSSSGSNNSNNSSNNSNNSNISNSNNLNTNNTNNNLNTNNTNTNNNITIANANNNITIANTNNSKDLANKQRINEKLSEIKTKLKNCPIIHKKAIFHIKNASTPILKFFDIFGMKFDLSVGNKNLKDYRDSNQNHVIFIKKSFLKFPGLEIFFLLLKDFLRRRGCSDTSRGGLNSTAIFALSFYFLRMHPMVQQGIDITRNVGVLMIDFFQFFGENRNFRISKCGFKKNFSGDVIEIEDFCNSENDLARLCTNYGSIRELFHYSYRMMAELSRNRVPKNKLLSSIWFRSDLSVETFNSLFYEEYLQ